MSGWIVSNYKHDLGEPWDGMMVIGGMCVR